MVLCRLCDEPTKNIWLCDICTGKTGWLLCCRGCGNGSKTQPPGALCEVCQGKADRPKPIPFQTPISPAQSSGRGHRGHERPNLLSVSNRDKEEKRKIAGKKVSHANYKAYDRFSILPKHVEAMLSLVKQVISGERLTPSNGRRFFQAVRVLTCEGDKYEFTPYGWLYANREDLREGFVCSHNRHTKALLKEFREQKLSEEKDPR